MGFSAQLSHKFPAYKTIHTPLSVLNSLFLLSTAFLLVTSYNYTLFFALSKYLFYKFAENFFKPSMPKIAKILADVQKIYYNR